MQGVHTMTPTNPPSEERIEQVARAKAVLAFLNGEGELDGCWFGDDTRPPFTSSRPYWWRKYLPDITAALEAADRGEGEELIEAATNLDHFAWSCVSTDCDESREYLQSLIDNLRAALAKQEPRV